MFAIGQQGREAVLRLDIADGEKLTFTARVSRWLEKADSAEGNSYKITDLDRF